MRKWIIAAFVVILGIVLFFVSKIFTGKENVRRAHVGERQRREIKREIKKVERKEISIDEAIRIAKMDVKDPFRMEATWSKVEKIILYATFVSEKERFADVNRMIVKEGDYIGNYKIEKIEKDFVIVNIGGRSVRIDLKQAVNVRWGAGRGSLEPPPTKMKIK